MEQNRCWSMSWLIPLLLYICILYFQKDPQLFEKKENKLKNAKNVAVIFIPIFCSMFIISFFGIGFSQSILFST